MVDPDPSRHAAHDTMLVAALAAGDLSDLARADGEAMVAACDDCATLHADLLAIATATHDLPAPVRTRDFRLSPRQAERLHPTRWRRALVVVGSPRSSLGRPLAVTFTTLGLAGLLLTALPAGAPGAWFGSSAGSERQGTTATDASGEGTVPSAVPVYGNGVPVVPGPAASTAPAPEATGGSVDIAGTGDQGDVTKGSADGTAGLTAELGGSPWLAPVSVALLVVGIVLFALRAAARRLRLD